MFAVVQCPDFFIQCERLFKPELNGRAILITSNDGNGGAKIIASSEQAQRLGLVSGLQGNSFSNAVSALNSDQKIVICSPNYELYSDLSVRFIRSLELLAPTVLANAPNEAQLNLKGLKVADNLHAYGIDLRNKLQRWLGITTIVGIAPTQALAKLASDSGQHLKEYQGVVDLNDGLARQNVLANTLAADISGISKKAANKLSAIHIHTALELCEAPKLHIRKHCSVVIERIALELSGLPCKGPELNPESSSSNCTIVSPIQSHAFIEIKRALNTLVANASEHLSSLTNSCQTVTVTLTNDRLSEQAPLHQATLSANLDRPAHNANSIQRLANELLESIWQEGIQYSSLKLNLENLSPSISDQFGLFSNLAIATKKAKQNYSPSVLSYETTLGNSNATQWRDKRALLSPSFTTKWAEIPRVS